MARTRRVGLTRYLIGIATVVVTGFGGAWLMVAPFALGYQPGGADWTDATKNDFWTGLAVLLVSVLGLVLFTVSFVGELRAAGIIRQRPAPAWGAAAPSSTGAASLPTPSDELERTLALLASTLAAELAERRQQRAAVTSQTNETVSATGRQE